MTSPINPDAETTPSRAVVVSDACYAIVTRYPTGVFALAYRGSQFFWMGMNEAESAHKLADLGIPENVVRWEEHYYDRSIPFSDPSCYKSRRYFPKQNDQARDRIRKN